MLNFKRDGTTVKVCVEHGIFFSGEHFALDINQPHEYQAKLLADALQRNLDKHLAAVQERYYREGWADAKKKTRKRIQFWGGWKQ